MAPDASGRDAAGANTFIQAREESVPQIVGGWCGSSLLKGEMRWIRRVSATVTRYVTAFEDERRTAPAKNEERAYEKRGLLFFAQQFAEGRFLGLCATRACVRPRALRLASPWGFSPRRRELMHRHHLRVAVRARAWTRTRLRRSSRSVVAACWRGKRPPTSKRKQQSPTVRSPRCLSACHALRPSEARE